MHQVSSRLSKLALSVMLAFALVPTASVAAMADPQISDPQIRPGHPVAFHRSGCVGRGSRFYRIVAREALGAR